jgi:serine/threonine protein phosphatase 1
MVGFLRSRRIVKKPRLPEGIRIYALGDIHGRSDLLKEMFTVIDADIARNPVSRPIEVFLGDYIDRGPNSAYTLDLLMSEVFTARRCSSGATTKRICWRYFATPRNLRIGGNLAVCRL